MDQDGGPVVVDAIDGAIAADTFNLNVADFHTYFVGDGHVWVHNTSPLSLVWDDLVLDGGFRLSSGLDSTVWTHPGRPGVVIKRYKKLEEDLARSHVDAVNEASDLMAGREFDWTIPKLSLEESLMITGEGGPLVATQPLAPGVPWHYLGTEKARIAAGNVPIARNARIVGKRDFTEAMRALAEARGDSLDPQLPSLFRTDPCIHNGHFDPVTGRLLSWYDPLSTYPFQASHLMFPVLPKVSTLPPASGPGTAPQGPGKTFKSW